MTRLDRLTTVASVTLLTAIVVHAALETIEERHLRFVQWRDSFLAPFINHPGRVEWLRDTLMREEMTIRDRHPKVELAARLVERKSVDDDCDCDDA